jgi:hypothetical protein
MAHGTHLRDPVGGECWFFVLGENDGEHVARIYFEIAMTHFMSFAEISRMLFAALKGPEGSQDDNEILDLMEELRELGEEGKRNVELMRQFKLPAEQLVRIWMQGLTALHRLAQIFPEVREENEAFIAEQYEAMVAMLERDERKQRAT